MPATEIQIIATAYFIANAIDWGQGGRGRFPHLSVLYLIGSLSILHFGGGWVEYTFFSVFMVAAIFGHGILALLD